MVTLLFSHPTLEIGAAVLGLLVSPLIVFFGHRLAAGKLEGERDLPAAAVLVPLVGGRLASWQPVRTALLEVISALVLACLAAHYGASIKLVLAAADSLLLIAVGYVDLEYRLVLNWFSYPGVLGAIAISSFWPGLGPREALVGAGVGLVTFAILQFLGRGALGSGDTKLAVLIGAMRGWPSVLYALMYGVAIGGIGALFFLMVLRLGRKDSIAYAPYLAAGAIASFFLNGP